MKPLKTSTCSICNNEMLLRDYEGGHVFLCILCDLTGSIVIRVVP